MSGAAESPLSENPAARIAKSLPGSDPRIHQLFEQPLQPIETLQTELDGYLARIRSTAQRTEFIDVDSATKVARVCGAMLTNLGPAPAHERQRLVQVAIRYFADKDDLERDFESPIGFDDDLRVAQAVAVELGMEEIVHTTLGEDHAGNA